MPEYNAIKEYYSEWAYALKEMRLVEIETNTKDFIEENVWILKDSKKRVEMLTELIDSETKKLRLFNDSLTAMYVSGWSFLDRDTDRHDGPEKLNKDYELAAKIKELPVEMIVDLLKALGQ